jgi:hypothetical protein
VLGILRARWPIGLASGGSCEGSRPADLVPNPESFATDLLVVSGGEQVASGAEVRSDDAVHLGKTLSVPSGFKPAHSPLPLARRLMGILGPVVQVPMLSMSNTRHHDPFCGGVAAQFVCDDHAWSTPSCPQQLAEEPDGSKSIPLCLHENIEDNTVLIDHSPKVVSHSVDLEKDFIQMPLVTGPSATSPQTGGIRFTKFVAPAPDRLIAEQHPPSGHQFFDITKAYSEPKIEPNTVRDDLSREPMATVRTVRHSSSMPSAESNGTNVTMPFRAIDSRGRTVDFYLSHRRDAGAARRFLAKALRARRDWAPSVINTDRNPAYGEAIRKLKDSKLLDDSVDHRQVKYLNNRLEADHGAIKRRIRSMLGFKSAKTAYATLKGIEVMRMIRKLQCILLRPGIAAEARFFNKLFGVYA